MIGIIGKKIGMTTFYKPDGNSLGCTVLECGPCVVTQLKNLSSDGYSSVQLAFEPAKEKNVSMPLLGHFKKASVSPKKKIAELRFPQHFSEDMPGLGKEILVENVFLEGEYLTVTGISKGKGFQGVVKRHGFSGVGSRTHGQHNRERAPGSIGASSFPSRVFKGMSMAGRMGGDKVSVSNLFVVRILKDKNVLFVSGSVPGPKGGYVILKKNL